MFTFAADASRKAFDAQLAVALQDADCPLFLVSTVRADFLDRFEQLPRLQAIYNRTCRRFFLPTISAAGLREVIEQPARLAGLDVSEIATAILEDARDEPGALPLVENALYLLWEQREGRRLSGARYAAADGLAGMLSAQADALLARLDRDQPQGRRAALELLLRLTRVNDDGRHSRRRISRAEAVLAAGGGDEALGERVVRALSGERPHDQPAAAAAANGALRLVTTGVEQGQGYVDLIHETLVRARGRDPRSGKRFGYWPTLYDYVEANRDRDLHRQELEFHTEQWRGARGLGRLTRLAGWRDLRRYRRLRVPRGSETGRFLTWGRRKAWAQQLLIVLFTLYAGESFLWSRLHDLPLDSMQTLQRFRFGYAPLPEMVDIPAGEFDMGEQDNDFLRSLPSEVHPYFGVPAHTVTVAKAYRLGKFEVTYNEFDYYVWSEHRAGRGGVKYPTTAKGGRGNRPVVNIDWKEASAYAAWLGKRRGETCRLPTEAEWEHAARAGTKTAYPWGNEVRRQRDGAEEVMANCDGCGSHWDNDQSAPVGSFPANAWGLHDTSGNVWEWTCSPWQARFDGSEKEYSQPGDTGSRVVRGGAWADVAVLSRAGARSYGAPGYRRGNLGVRVFCSSPIE